MIEGDREATPEELAAREAGLLRAEVLGQIERTERTTMLPRAVREFMLAHIEEKAAALGASQGLTAEEALTLLSARNLGYRNVKRLDADIAALRRQLK
jgi:hypothetical protein